MRDAETTLVIIQARGRDGLHMEDVYRRLFNPDLYLRAYGRISRNAGALTQGVTGDTADGMSLERIGALIEDIRHERYRWTPVRRILIPKANRKMRPLGIPTWSDKLLQEVMRSILEAYYEPQFSDHSHGFRPGLGCDTALQDISQHWKGTKWFIEGDIKGCFDNIDHQILLSILREKLHDNRFLRLVETMLGAGYLERWDYRPTLSGTPQGGIISPLLANIYLDRLDRHVETTISPAYNRGGKKRLNPEYVRLCKRRSLAKEKGDMATYRELGRTLSGMATQVAYDPAYRRLKYVRYADDFLLGFHGPESEAETIKGRIGDFLRDHLKLELSPEKTLITPASEFALCVTRMSWRFWLRALSRSINFSETNALSRSSSGWSTMSGYSASRRIRGSSAVAICPLESCSMGLASPRTSMVISRLSSGTIVSSS